MTNKLPIRAGVFENESSANAVVGDLLALGFRKENIRVVSKHASVEGHADNDVEELSASGAHTRKSVLWGSSIGGVSAGLIAVITTSTSSGAGLIIAGSLLAAVVGGALVGGFIGSMMSRGFEPEIADFHDQSMRRGQFLVAVEGGRVGPQVAEARAVFARAGVSTISLRKS